MKDDLVYSFCGVGKGRRGLGVVNTRREGMEYIF